MKFTKLMRWLVITFAGIAVLLLFLGGTPVHGAPGMPANEYGPSNHSPANVPNLIKPTPSFTVTLAQWRNLRPTESYLYGVSVLPPTYTVDCFHGDQKSRGWIVGQSGVILRYCNGVWDQAIFPESVPTDLFGVQAISPTLGVAVGAQGTILMYLYDQVAGDWVWTKAPIAVTNRLLYDVSMVPNGNGTYTGWAVGQFDPGSNSRGTLVKGEIGPKYIGGTVGYTHQYTWTNLTSLYNLPAVDYYSSIQMLAPNNGWAVGGKDSTDGNGGPKAVILHWNGSTWSVHQQFDGKNALVGLFMRSVNDGWAVGEAGQIYHFNGSTWSSVASPINGTFVSVGFAPNGEGWIAGLDGVLLKYVNDSTWIEPPINDRRTDKFDFWGMDFTSGHGWLVGYHQDATDNVNIGGHILEYDDGLWLAVTVPTDNRLNAVVSLSDDNAWAVGKADSSGGTIIHWDGKHWQRWFQRDLPIPKGNLNTLHMVSPTDGWAAGDPLVPGGPAVFLRWDGNRWAPLRYNAPVNVPVNSLSMKDGSFGWAVADDGNAVAKYDANSGFWSANYACFGVYYQLMGTSVVSITGPTNPNWDAWAVSRPNTHGPGRYGYASFLRFMSGCPDSNNAWQTYQNAVGCPNPTPTPPPPGTPVPTPEPPPSDGPTNSVLRGIQMKPDQTGVWGYAVGEYNQRATFYLYNGGSWSWPEPSRGGYCQPPNFPGVTTNPSRFNSVDILDQSNVTWFGGSYFDSSSGRLVAFITYVDRLGFGWAGDPIPLNGKNIYHRPVASISMSSDTMGWAVGDTPDHSDYSVIYQYPSPNFTMKVSPSNRAIKPGQSTSYTLTVNSLGGFSADVALSLGPLPPGVTASLSTGTVNPDTVATIYVTTTAGTALGLYDLPLYGAVAFRSGTNIIYVVRQASYHLTVTQNPVYSVSPSAAPAGTIVTIDGSGFGVDPGPGSRSTATNHVILAGQQMPDANVISWSPTQIKVSVPDNSTLFPEGPTLGSVSVTASGSDSNTDLAFQLQNYLTGSAVVSRVGGVITARVTGTSLGNDPGPLLRSTAFEHVTLSGVQLTTNDVTAWSNNIITFTVLSNTAPGPLSVTSNGYQSNIIAFDPGGFKVYLPLIRKG